MGAILSVSLHDLHVTLLSPEHSGLAPSIMTIAIAKLPMAPLCASAELYAI